MPKHLPVTQARVNLGRVLTVVNEKKIPVVLERNGEPIAAILNIDDFEDYLELHDPEACKAIAESRRDFEQGKTLPLDDLLSEFDAPSQS